MLSRIERKKCARLWPQKNRPFAAPRRVGGADASAEMRREEESVGAGRDLSASSTSAS